MDFFPCKVLMKLLSKFITGLTGANLTFSLINSDPQVIDPGTESPIVDIPMPYIKYITMLKIQMHVGAIRKLSYNLCVCTGANLWLKPVDYLSLQTHRPYYYLHVSNAEKSNIVVLQ